MSTQDLVNAIIVGDAVEIETAFNATMAEKISSRLDDYRQEVAQNMFKVQEEFAQLDEISKKTLGSYISKASKSASGLATTAMHHKNYSKDWANVADSSVGPTKKHASKRSDEFAKASFDATEKQIKRQKGIDTAVKKLTKEDVEQILASEEFAQLDELSKKTLKSYLNKSDTSFDAAVKSGDKNTQRKRTKGETLAVNSLERKANSRNPFESVEQLVVTTVESALYAMEAGRSVLDENIDEAVSSSSKQRYEYANKTKPKGHGQWMFTTVDPKEHDVQKHKDQTVSVTGSFADAAKKAHSHFKEKGHKGEIHVLS